MASVQIESAHVSESDRDEALNALMLPWRKAVGANGSKLYRFGKVRGARLIRSKKPGKKFMAYCPALKKGYGDGATGEGVYGGGIKGGHSIGGYKYRGWRTAPLPIFPSRYCLIK